MLVEDDKSLREIYGVRLLAEGYDIISAGDGEAALAMAIKERPSLIVSDVMMPKISGFDMLDILRSTTETKNIKVIMMTALGSEEQRARGDQLGADRYLVKSQVGIEDVVRTVHEVLGDRPTPAPAQTPAVSIPVNTEPPAAPRPPVPAINRVSAPVVPPVAPATSIPITTPPPVDPTTNPRQMASQPALQPPTPVPAHPATQPVQQHSQLTPTPPSSRNRVIQPLNDPATTKININELLDRELAKEAGIDIENRPAITSTEQEKAMVQNQLEQFSTQPATQPSSPQPMPNPTPTIQIDTEGRVSTPPSIPPTPPQNGPVMPPPPPPIR